MKFWLDTMIPLPTRPGLTNNYVNTQGFSNDRDAIQVRGDHNIGSKDLLSFRWSRQRVGQNQPGGNPYLSQVSRFDVDNMMASWNHIFSPTTVLEVKFGRNVPILPQPPVNTKIQRQDFLTKAGISMFIPERPVQSAAFVHRRRRVRGGSWAGRSPATTSISTWRISPR